MPWGHSGIEQWPQSFRGTKRTAGEPLNGKMPSFMGGNMNGERPKLISWVPHLQEALTVVIKANQQSEQRNQGGTILNGTCNFVALGLHFNSRQTINSPIFIFIFISWKCFCNFWKHFVRFTIWLWSNVRCYKSSAFPGNHKFVLVWRLFFFK